MNTEDGPRRGSRQQRLRRVFRLSNRENDLDASARVSPLGSQDRQTRLRTNSSSNMVANFFQQQSSKKSTEKGEKHVADSNLQPWVEK